MTPRARVGASRAPVIPFPDFDQNRWVLMDCFHAVDCGAGRKALASLRGALKELGRVRNSPRHERLCEFLSHVVTAVEANQMECAKYILLTAFAAFGWPADASGSLT